MKANAIRKISEDPRDLPIFFSILHLLCNLVIDIGRYFESLYSEIAYLFLP